MTADDLTPAEREAVQEHYLRRYMARVDPQGFRRRTDPSNRLHRRAHNPRWGYPRADPAPGFDPTPRDLAVRL